MFQFLFGVAFGAAGYWAWQSFGRDLLGMGGDQGETSYGGFSNSSSFGTSPSTSIGTGGSSSTSTSTPAASTSTGSVGSSSGSPSAST
jgi:hypothetical protein